MLAATAMAVVFATAAHAAPTIVYDTELGAIAPGTTTTDSAGTRSTNAGATLGSEAPAADEWQQRNVRQNGVVGITTDYADANGGNGSIYFSTDGSNPSKADMEYYFSTPQLLSDFTGGGYDWLRDSASTIGSAPAPAYRLIMNNAAGGFGYFVYEPYNQPPGTVATDAWQTTLIDTSTSLFWATGLNFTIPAPGGVGPSCQSCLHTLAEWSAANTGAKVIGFSTGVGSGWNGGTFVGAVDNVSFAFGRDTASFDFEVSAVPEPATWALMISGFGLAGVALRRRRLAALNA
ncbi:PEPxxWA-CTERM sorting domain-containing protein [Phenylobacterium sp.]|uniref:PEPxxWA-CTERM sorting domain-containing protein n=1 Tax=Phenylobacterium sp. TaxID=1871053 RepID=UPI0027351159|nr:PEPxxWA-CTERM sorting domain-containing protein [Phenylobacterium sp.]MDP3856114.1 PEPxxWA-CTERM sorting domain-containing protein [Phenylobacterium sp.]